MVTFRYKYQIHPFDDWRYFTIHARDQLHADAAAIEEFGRMFDRGQTVMTVFYRA